MLVVGFFCFQRSCAVWACKTPCCLVKTDMFGRKKKWLARHNFSSRNVLPEPPCFTAGPGQAGGRRDTSCCVMHHQFSYRRLKPFLAPPGTTGRGMEGGSTLCTKTCWSFWKPSPLVSVTARGMWPPGDTGYGRWHGECHSSTDLGQAPSITKAHTAARCPWMRFWMRTQFSKCF